MVFLDWDILGTNGFELEGRMWECDTDVKIILLTCHQFDDPVTNEILVEAKFSDVLCNPICIMFWDHKFYSMQI